jgi:hypothetical protein
MSLPVVLVRSGADVVPVILGRRDNELAGYSVATGHVVPVDIGMVIGAVNADPAAVYWGMDLVEEEREQRAAAEADRRTPERVSTETYRTWRIESRPYSHRGERMYEAGIFGNDGLADVAHGKTRSAAVANARAMIDRHVSHDRLLHNLGLDADAWRGAREDRSTPLAIFAASFLANVEGSGNPRQFRNDPRVPKIVEALETLGVGEIGEILGSGTFGTAAILDDDHVVKITSDPSEVQAGHVLTGKKLRHVARVDGAWFVKGVRAKTLIGKIDGKEIRRRYPTGILVVERVNGLGGKETEDLSDLVNDFKKSNRVYPDQLAKLSHADQRDRLRRASLRLQDELEETSELLRTERRSDEADLADGVAGALDELRGHGVYAIDVHGGNVGYVESEGGKRTYKVFDIGSSSPPARPKAQPVDDDSAMDLEDAGIQLAFSGMLSEASEAAGWIGGGADEMEVVDAGAEETDDEQGWALVNEDGQAVNDERFATDSDAYMSARVTYRGPRRTADGRPMLIGRTVWVSQVDAAGAAVSWLESGAREAPTTALGIRFTPIESGAFGGEFLTGFTEVRPQLMKHREQTPSVETIILSTVFAGLTVHTQIATAEKSFKCVTNRLRGGRMPTLADIDDCLVPLGLIKSRRAMYESAGTWAPLVQEAMKSGLRDRALRRHLYLTTETPHDIALAKLSFVLALLGQDVCCLDARILNRMYEREEANRLAHEFGRPPSERMLARYEATEDAFLDHNAFFRPSDPLGRARAQWNSWEAVGGKPANHAVWLGVVSG